MTKNSKVPPVSPAGWPDAAKPGRMVGFLLRSLHLSLRQSMDEALRQRGLELSFAHFAALFSLHFEPGATGAQLARRALASAQTTNSVLRRLEKEGLVERRPHPESRRADSWYLTREGTEQLERAREIGDAVFDRMLSALSHGEIEQLQASLSRCVAALGAPDSFMERIAAEHAETLRIQQRRRA